MAILNKTSVFLCLTARLWIINFTHDNNYLNKQSELINADILTNFYKGMSSDEFDSSSTLYECIVVLKICFGCILSYIGIVNSLAVQVHIR